MPCCAMHARDSVARAGSQRNFVREYPHYVRVFFASRGRPVRNAEPHEYARICIPPRAPPVSIHAESGYSASTLRNPISHELRRPRSHPCDCRREFIRTSCPPPSGYLIRTAIPPTHRRSGGHPNAIGNNKTDASAQSPRRTSRAKAITGQRAGRRPTTGRQLCESCRHPGRLSRQPQRPEAEE